MNLAENLRRTVANHPDNTVIRLEGTSFDYAWLDEAASRVAGLLAAKEIRSGDRVGLMLGNVPEFAAIYYGILRLGAVVVPMNPLLKSREVEYYLNDSGATVMFVAETMHAEADEAAKAVPGSEVISVATGKFVASLSNVTPFTDWVERADEDTAVILYTSGTTGHPKGAELTHHNLIANIEVLQSDLLKATSDDVIFAGLPLFHAFGQTGTLNLGIAAGATLVLLPRFDAVQALNLMLEEEITVFAGVPTMYNAFLQVPEPPQLPKLRICISGGAALPVEVLNQFEATFGVPIMEAYGLSETSPAASYNSPEANRAGSIGKPFTGVEMRITGKDRQPLPAGERGEIEIRGHNIMRGYWNKPEATAAAISDDGWFRTGDVGMVDDDGFFFIVDRVKDLIIRGGYNVYPREIEEVLYEHPAIAEAAVVGIPHESMGEEVGAAVALKAGAQATPEELRDYVKGQVAAYKYPRVVWIVDELPKGATGKIVKREIELPTEATGSSL